eukprot:152404-Ditylum_brightwellii.AAC.1
MSLYSNKARTAPTACLPQRSRLFSFNTTDEPNPLNQHVMAPSSNNEQHHPTLESMPTVHRHKHAGLFDSESEADDSSMEMPQHDTTGKSDKSLTKDPHATAWKQHNSRRSLKTTMTQLYNTYTEEKHNKIRNLSKKGFKAQDIYSCLDACGATRRLQL